MLFHLKEILSYWIRGFYNGDYEELDVTPCSPVEVHRNFEAERRLPPASSLVHAWVTL
jgi:hypothetical protein